MGPWEEIERLIETEAEAALLEEGYNNPLPEAEARRLLTRCVDVLREGALSRGDEQGAASLAEPTEVLVNRLLAAREVRAFGDAPDCECGHSYEEHCMLQQGDCIARNCLCERWVPGDGNRWRLQQNGTWKVTPRIERKES